MKFISGQLLKGLEEGIREMEELMKNYGIPFPMRPPAGSNTTSNLEHLTDRDIYTAIFEGIQSFFPILSSAFMNSTSPLIRKKIKNHLLLTLELQELIVEFGKQKGYLYQPPGMKTSN